MFTARLIIAVVSTIIEEAAIYVVWRWLLPEFDINLPVSVLIGIMIAWAVFSIALFVFTSRTLRLQGIVGLPTMIGSRGRAASTLDPGGMVRIKGELWGATSPDGTIAKDEEVAVVGEDGLNLIVRRVKRK
jgi:membrane-bound serine protease (ClpP class)